MLPSSAITLDVGRLRWKCFVTESDEIANLSLIRDIMELVELAEVL